MRPGLSDHELRLLCDTLRRHPRVVGAILFGSRAKGTHSPQSDVDLAVVGNLTPLEAESIAGELEELPLPYHFEVQSLERITHEPLREHIGRVGIRIYPTA